MDTNKQLAVTQTSPYRAFADEDAASAIAGDMVTFNKGLWIRGKDKNPVPIEALFISNLDEGYRGMVRWFDGKPVDYRIGRISEGFPMPLRDELGHEDETKWETNQSGAPKDPWQPTYRLVMRDSNGELVTFVGSSWGARRGLQQLYGRFDRERKGPTLWPVVRLTTEHYPNKTWGPIPEPRFTIIGWAQWDGRPDVKAIASPGPVPTPDDPRTQFAQELDDSIPF